jgi:glycosyltransferase involved in cell wall biosynthesis
MRNVSVVMAALNAEQTLRRATKTTLSAMGNDDELLIVDDGSTDATNKIAKEIDDRRVKVVTNSQNLGLARSLNIGIEAASNEIIARMDADDACFPWRFRVQRRIFERVKPDLLFGTQVLSLNSFPLVVPHTYVTRASPGSLTEAMALACVLAHPTLMSTKSTLLSMGGYRNVVAEDYDLWLRAILSDKKILRHWVPVNLYTMNNNSLSERDSTKRNYLSHLRCQRLKVFRMENQEREDRHIPLMRAYRRRLAIRDPFLFLETGVFTNPIETLRRQSE